MSTPHKSTSRWRGKPVIPDDYHDVAHIVRMARKARGRIVEFDWFFSADELLLLRRAAFEWGNRVVGRYKCFDARVLLAIAEALGEKNTIFSMSEPKNADGLDCAASCVDLGDGFIRLTGHAPFDIIFGYGNAGVKQDKEVEVQLGPSVRATLAGAVGMLGWDLHRLQEKRYQPVKNALYGLPLNYGINETGRAPGPSKDIHIHFYGTFSLVDDDSRRCLFFDAMADRVGVYLWTINVGGEERPWYVGQTRRGFATRMSEHIAGYLSGEYPAYDASALAHGTYRRADGTAEASWPQRLPSFLQNYQRSVPNIIELIRLINIHVAPLDGEAHLLDRVEGAIGRYYKAHSDRELRDFFLPGIRVPAAVPFDNAVRLRISSDAPVAGLPEEMLL